MKTTKCPQMKCAFNIIGGCRNCEVCDCPPNEINEGCDRCWNCAYDEGILRWDNAKNGDNTQDEKEKDKEEEKPILIEEKVK